VEEGVPSSYGLQEMAAARVTTVTAMDISGVSTHCQSAVRRSKDSSHGTASAVPPLWQPRTPVEPTLIR
jgi:hypothetical protein